MDNNRLALCPSCGDIPRIEIIDKQTITVHCGRSYCPKASMIYDDATTRESTEDAVRMWNGFVDGYKSAARKRHPILCIGAKVYVPIIDESDKIISVETVTEIGQRGIFIAAYRSLTEGDFGDYLPFEDFGKTWFLTEFEAEEAI